MLDFTASPGSWVQPDEEANSEWTAALPHI